MKKKNLKTLIHDIEIALAELKSEVYSDAAAYRISSDTDKHTTYLDVNDDDGICDWWLQKSLGLQWDYLYF